MERRPHREAQNNLKATLIHKRLSCTAKKLGRFRNCWSGAQFIEQSLGLLQIECVEAFGEPAIDRSEKIASLIPPP